MSQKWNQLTFEITVWIFHSFVKVGLKVKSPKFYGTGACTHQMYSYKKKIGENVYNILKMTTYCSVLIHIKSNDSHIYLKQTSWYFPHIFRVAS